MVLVFVAACGGSDSGSDSGSAPAERTNPQTTSIGMYNPDYDYSLNQRYKVTYVVSNNTSGLYTASSGAFAHWASLMNVEYNGMLDFGGDDDALFSQLPQLARDNDGLLFDADANTYDRVYEIMKGTGTPWHAFMGAPRDYSIDGNPLVSPYVGFEQYDVGAFFANYMREKAPDFFPGVPMSEFGFMVVDFSVAPPLHQRMEGCRDTLAASGWNMDRFFVADTAIAFFDADTSRDVVSAVLAMNPDIKYWLIFAEIDDMAQGAAAALDLAGLGDTSFVSAFGGTALQMQWDAGRQDAWRSAQYLPQTIFVEPIFCSLYAFMNGDATPETIFPEWKNKNENQHYGHFSTRLLPWYEILFENYQYMIRWSDVYAGSNLYPNYPLEINGRPIARDDFSTTVPIPAHFR